LPLQRGHKRTLTTIETKILRARVVVVTISTDPSATIVATLLTFTFRDTGAYVPKTVGILVELVRVRIVRAVVVARIRRAPDARNIVSLVCNSITVRVGKPGANVHDALIVDRAVISVVADLTVLGRICTSFFRIADVRRALVGIAAALLGKHHNVTSGLLIPVPAIRIQIQMRTVSLLIAETDDLRRIAPLVRLVLVQGAPLFRFAVNPRQQAIECRLAHILKAILLCLALP